LRKLPRHKCDVLAEIATLTRKAPDFLKKLPGTQCASISIMPTMFTYRDLDAWKLGMDPVEECYRTTAAFPRSELYGLTGQMRRACVSIPANVAEGHARRTTRAYLNHVSIAIGSHAEVATCIELSGRLAFLAPAERDRLTALSDSVGRLHYGLYRALDRKASQRVSP
jgi:four helix bundle protein